MGGLEKARDETEAASFVQRALPFVAATTTDEQRQILDSFVQEEPERDPQLAKGDRAAHVDKYASKSHSVIELLKGLQQDFEKKKLAATKAETNALNSYDVETKARDNAEAAAGKSKDEKTEAFED